MKRKTFKDFKDGLANPVPNNRYADEHYIDHREKQKEEEFNSRTLYDNKTVSNKKTIERLEKIDESRNGYRQTASGRWRERDEPDELEQDRQNDSIRKFLQKKRALAGKTRLKAANKIPVRAKTGEKIFESVRSKKPVCVYNANNDESMIKCLFKIGQSAYDFDDFIFMLNQLIDAANED